MAPSWVFDHSFRAYAKFSEKLTFLIPWYAHVRRIKFKHTFEVGLFGIMIDEKWNCSTHWKCLSSLRCWPAWIIHRRSRPEVFCEKNCPYKFRKISKSFKNAVFNRTPPVIVFFQVSCKVNFWKCKAFQMILQKVSFIMLSWLVVCYGKPNTEKAIKYTRPCPFNSPNAFSFQTWYMTKDIYIFAIWAHNSVHN